MFLTSIKLYKWYQIVQNSTYVFCLSSTLFPWVQDVNPTFIRRWRSYERLMNVQLQIANVPRGVAIWSCCKNYNINSYSYFLLFDGTKDRAKVKAKCKFFFVVFYLFLLAKRNSYINFYLTEVEKVGQVNVLYPDIKLK